MGFRSISGIAVSLDRAKGLSIKVLRKKLWTGTRKEENIDSKLETSEKGSG